MTTHTPRAATVNRVPTSAGRCHTLIATRHRLANARAPTAIPKKATGIEPRLLFITEPPKVATRSDVLAVRDRWLTLKAGEESVNAGKAREMARSSQPR